MRQQENRFSKHISLIASLATLVLILVVACTGVQNLSKTSGDEGVVIAKRALERGVALCYAAEGFYPPSLTYLETHYGVNIDKEQYIIRYEVFASNIFPEIIVVPK